MPQVAKRILVVEDDPESLAALEDALDAGGFETIAARTGVEALALLKASPPPALIVLDLMLPLMDGWQFVAEMRRHAAVAAVPVVIVSGERDLAETAAQLGVAGYLRKPITVDALLDAVERFTSVNK